MQKNFLGVKARWKNYTFQGLPATVAVFCVLLFPEQGEEGIAASFGTTAFVILALPDSFSTQPHTRPNAS